MAIFIASTKSISRGKGQSAVASASYRAGVELEDKRYGKKHDYSKRHGVMSADIILPSSLANQGITIERNDLWNLAEEAETRKNSRVAREWLVNLPHELNEQTRKQLAHDFSQQLADKFGVIADCAIHRPTQKEIERGADARNYHAHIMLTTRQAELDNDGNITLTDKSVCELSDTDRAKKGLSKAKDEVTEIRQLWENLANEKLAEHNHQLIDSRSYKSQGIDLLPQVKMGKDATHLERDGVQTWKGDINRAITERNEIVFSRELLENKHINDKAEQIIEKQKKKLSFTERMAEIRARNTQKTPEQIQAEQQARNEQAKRLQKKQEPLTQKPVENTQPDKAQLMAEFQDWKADREKTKPKTTLERTEKLIETRKDKRYTKIPEEKNNRLKTQNTAPDVKKSVSMATLIELRDQMYAEINQIAKQLHQTELNELVKQSKPLLVEFEHIRDNKPLIWGKKQWEQDKHNSLDAYNAIREKWLQTRNKGVTQDHRDEATAIFVQKGIKQYNRMVNIINNEINPYLQGKHPKQLEMQAQCDGIAQAGRTYTGKIIANNEFGIIQQSATGKKVYHKIDDLELSHSHLEQTVRLIYPRITGYGAKARVLTGKDIERHNQELVKQTQKRDRGFER